jgi:hypothetical protein
MNTYIFTVVVDRRPSDAEFDTAFEIGLDDAAFGFEGGAAVVHFDREAATMADAVASAVNQLERLGLVAFRVADNDLVTLADIAERVGQSRESIRRYSTGDRGPGGFPPPLNPAREGTVFYRWSEVAPWMRRHLNLDAPDGDPTLVVANLVLQARRLLGKVDHASALTDLLLAA